MRMLNYYRPFNFNARKAFAFIVCLFLLNCISAFTQSVGTGTDRIQRERISINEGWRFYKYKQVTRADSLIYDVRPEIRDRRDDDTEPTEAEDVEATQIVAQTLGFANW
jgi:beta-galactosidase